MTGVLRPIAVEHNLAPVGADSVITASLTVTIFLGAFAELQKLTISFVMSVHPHGTTRLPLDGFSRNLIFEDF